MEKYYEEDEARRLGIPYKTKAQLFFESLAKGSDAEASTIPDGASRWKPLPDVLPSVQQNVEDTKNRKSTMLADRGAAALEGLESAYDDMFKPVEGSPDIPFRMPGLTDVEDQVDIEPQQESTQTDPRQQFISTYLRPQADNSLNQAQAEEGRLMAMLLQNKSQSDLLSGLFDAASRAGSAIAGTKYDPSAAQSLRKMGESQQQAGQADLAFRKSQRQEAETKKDKQLERRKAEIGLDNIEKLNDPTSPVAQYMRKLAKDTLGVLLPEDASPHMLQQAGWPLGNMISQIVASDNKKELKQLEMAAKQERELQKLDETKSKWAQSLRKETTAGSYGKQFDNYMLAKDTVSKFKRFLDNPKGTPFQDFNILLQGLKNLQGDDSVVRGEEMKLGQDAVAFWDRIKNYGKKLIDGTTLQPEQRKDMMKVIEYGMNIGEVSYIKSIAPILNQATEKGIDHTLVIPYEFIDKYHIIKKHPQITMLEDINRNVSDKADNNLKTFMKNNPSYTKEKAIELLTSKGMYK